MKDASDVERVLLHESLGHFGLRGVFGDKLDGILRQVSALRHSDLIAKAKQYGLDMRLQKDRLIAAEEVLAELAQNNPKNTLVQRAIAAIRTWLRENMPSLFKHMAMTDAEIINNYLLPARDFVQQGRKVEAAPGGLAGAFSRRKETITFTANRLLAGLAQDMRVATNHDAAREEARKVAGIPLTNLSTGMVASVSKRSAKKMVDDSVVGKSATLGAHYAAVANVDKLFVVSIRAEQRPGNKEEDALNIKAVHSSMRPCPSMARYGGYG